jgi:alkylation response protein AidB-like acyl-CoA dehydrogenase
MICASARAQRVILEECLKWVSQRKAFGKPLSSQAVVRAKLAQMAARAEAVQSWLENVTYQMCNMVRRDSSFLLCPSRVPIVWTRANMTMTMTIARSRTRNKRRNSPARSLS